MVVFYALLQDEGVVQDKRSQVPDFMGKPISEALCMSDRLFLHNLDLSTTESDVRGFLTDNGIQVTKLEFDTEFDTPKEEKKICNVTLASPDQMGKVTKFVFYSVGYHLFVFYQT